MYNIFLTGEKGIGKTTIINKILSRINCEADGYTVKPIIEGTLKHFYITSIKDDAKKALMATGDTTKRKIINIYGDSLNKFGTELVNNSVNTKDIIILDEIGFIESKCSNFKNSIINALNSNKIVIGVLKEFNGDFINSIKKREDVILFTVSEKNRDELPGVILNILTRRGDTNDSTCKKSSSYS
ncbi:Nucleoside-triphosphatase THEP1 [Clostridium liquoris]|jgi:nucleoside-triphosphatase|uniref:Nucleoside-triphosphatase THEP1 n=1 Tax=Clostridium liquoris TaxID=1289519 RepID=A0A2T0B0Q4_9CLOT|nr:nucleoside-triphosphatase [Clostridium liquoris]PRR77165.1 Nucleoside-triphosphatase THEP1 [Clostridium liquoris]